MSDFLSTFVALTTSPVLVVGAAEFDRNVKIRLTNAIRVGFASDAIEFVPQFDAGRPIRQLLVGLIDTVDFHQYRRQIVAIPLAVGCLTDGLIQPGGRLVP